MIPVNFIVAVLMTTFVAITLASPTADPSRQSSNSFFTSFLPTSSYAFIEIAGPLPGEGHILGQVTNKCPYAVWVRQAVAETSSVTGERCEFFGETADFKLEPGLTWISPRRSHWDGCGSSLKVSRNLGDARVYQVEYSIDRHTKKVWYNLSAEDGAPFQDVERYLAVGSVDCKAVYCAPGQYGKDRVHGCDWPIQPVCVNIGQVLAVICGRW